MRLRRDVSGADLAKALKKYGYQLSRQTGSHMRLSTEQSGEHHVALPKLDPLRIVTLAAVLGEVADHFSVSRDVVAKKLFGF